MEEIKDLNSDQFVERVFERDDLLKVCISFRQLNEEEEGIIAKNLTAVDLS